ncbi:assimilatory sulfite reductase (NADPH) flavoprotein subunit [Alginatibacterium sediminis]|uniref:Sulfite reductase [NADPH] flavoprotein alpha-component n=1 Tax=Alginatibacterium sediminis TaxID=2164068 RepID=A0A420E9L8_9ALTE|nr:assimilatory sulfite reductase (NADPH) flavoprotein subunit [Alginatibacterium sediminis]RKF15872.1 assimilatory sulfite reductase (NADPH) flavoprotein subunit [Alginatibacterium sediminis]
MLLKELNALASPLSDQQVKQLQQATAELSSTQLAWVSGYLAGVGQSSTPLQSVSASQSAQKLTILYASQTGNAKGVAEQLLSNAQQQGISVELFNVADYKPKSLKQETHLVIVTSTNGEGEPPDDAIDFHEFLASKKAPKLDQLQYAILALGDSSYEFFCQTGKDFDERLSALGAKPLLTRLDADVDYENEAKAWAEQALGLVSETLSASNGAEVVSLPVSASHEQRYSKNEPYAAELLSSQKITGRDSNKDVRHIEIDLEDSGISYSAGDALGVWFDNDEHLVSQLIESLGLDPQSNVEIDGEQLSLQQALTEKLEITLTAPNFVEQWALWSKSARLNKLLADKAKLREYAANHQIIDVIREKKAKVSAQDLVSALRKLTPRLYSIASSQAEVEEEVHLTVGVVEYNKGDATRLGGASGFLGRRLKEGDKVKVFVEHNDNFKLPSDPQTPIIMIGPGTGVAPFRAFMQERENQDNAGDSWMFFGDQTFTEDFLYQLEWQKYLSSGVLSKMDVAFSRDQAQKIYVQDRIAENAQQVWQWLERGAHVYICGDANRMAKDVHQTLLELVSQQGQLDTEQAENYLSDLRRAKRYQKDVY